jgi:hypothetical protein
MAAAPDTLIYVYGFIPTKEYSEKQSEEMNGMDENYMVDYHTFDDITVVTSRVRPEEFSEEALQKNVEDMKWLQKKAFHHHQLTNKLHEMYTVIPLKFGTIYNSEESLASVVTGYGQNIREVFGDLAGNEEWSIKIYTDKEMFSKAAGKNSPEITEKQKEIAELPRGKQFFEKKKLDKLIQEVSERELTSYCETVHEEVKMLARNNEVKKNWEKKLTEREDDMCWNAAYLIPEKNVQKVIDLVKEKQKASEDFTFEITGPWPPFHFSNFAKKEKA